MGSKVTHEALYIKYFSDNAMSCCLTTKKTMGSKVTHEALDIKYFIVTMQVSCCLRTRKPWDKSSQMKH